MSEPKNIFAWTPVDGQVFFLDDYHMGLAQLEHFYLLDYFIEPSYPNTKSIVYLWQNKKDKNFTVKAQVTICESNEYAHKVMHKFIDSLANSAGYKTLHSYEQVKETFGDAADTALSASRNIDATGLKSVENSNVLLVWANIFLNISSVGEKDFDTKAFVTDLGSYKDDQPTHSKEDGQDEIELTLSSHSIKVGETATVNYKQIDMTTKFACFLIVTAHHDYVTLYKKNNQIYIEGLKECEVELPVFVIGFKPDGTIEHGGGAGIMVTA